MEKSIKKHGKENFSKEILLWCFSLDELDIQEKRYIKMYDSMNPSKGYNLVSGGQQRMPKELLNLHGKDNPNYGNKWSDEQKLAARNLMKGKYSGRKNPNSRGVKCVETGETWEYTGDLANDLGVKSSTVCTYIGKKKRIKGKTYVRI